jgi:hypothetical protein
MAEPKVDTQLPAPTGVQEVNRPADMVGQFLLGKTEVQALASWSKQQIGQWILHWHPRLPVTRIRSQDGSDVGWVMGIAVDPEGQVLPAVWQLRFNCDEADSADRFESALNGLGGRFAAVYLTSQDERFYLDASGSLAAVYCEEHQVVASSCNLVLQVGDLPQNSALVQAFGLPQRDGYLPFQLTPWSGITRLLPNHYLNLGNWVRKRHWPNRPLLDPTRRPDKIIRDIAGLVECFISGVTKLGAAQIPLTAGYDTRVLLACSRPSLPSIHFFTSPIPDVNARMDCAYGRLRPDLEGPVRTGD